MKKIISLVCSIALLLSVAACGNVKDDSVKAEPTPTPMVDENLITVDITLPAKYFEDKTEDEIMQEAAEDEYYQTAKVNDDGSVTYTMTKANYKSMMKEFAEGLDKTFSEYVGNEEVGLGYIQDVKHSKDFTEVNYTVDPDAYDSQSWIAAHVTIAYCAYYQALSNVPEDDIHVVVNFLDMNTGDVVETFDTNDLGE